MQSSPPRTSLGEIFRLQSVVEVGHGHAALEVESAQTIVSGVDVGEAVVQNAVKGVLDGFLLERVLLGGFPRR